MSKFGYQTHSENLGFVGQLEKCQAGYLLSHPGISILNKTL